MGEKMDNFLGELAIILIGLVLAIIVGPIIIGLIIATLFNLTGTSYYAIIIIVTLLSWLIVATYYNEWW